MTNKIVRKISVETETEESEFIQPLRTEDEILHEIGILVDKVWYNRHCYLRERVEAGQIKVAPGIWEAALEDAKDIEKRYPKDELVADTVFDWGMLSGKLSALRWVLGADWDVPGEFAARRTEDEIWHAEGVYFDKIWYNRHLSRREEVEAGLEEVAPEIWKGTLENAKRVEERYPDGPLPWTSFEWGMFNGRFSALHWVVGEDWDMLDT